MLGLVLQRAVDGEHQVRAPGRRLQAAQPAGDVGPTGVALDDEAPGMAFQGALVLELHARQPVAVQAHRPEDGDGQVTLGEEALRLGQE